MPKLPLSPFKVYSTVNEVRDQSEGSVKLLIAGSDSEAMAAVKSALAAGSDPRVEGSILETVQLGEDEPLRDSLLRNSEGVLILIASPAELSSEVFNNRLADAGKNDLPVVVVLTEAPGIELSFPGVGPSRVVGMAPGSLVPADLLVAAVVDAAGDTAVAMSAKLPALRDETCRVIIKRTARQNAVVGALFIIPGADMPVMTMNEARMVFRIAAAHGESVGTERALELLGVVGSGFGLRAIARQLVDFIPGPGWVIKSGIAWSGTRALGKTATTYFNGSVRVTPSRLAPLADRLKKLRG
ncbi:MAG: DUF697 domain-containing protein [Thermoleophilia bacterium]